MTTQLPSWLRGITAKRPDVALLVHALIVAGLRQGYVTAEDGHNIPVSHANVRGAAMKYLRHAGFAMDPTPLRATTRQSHAHWIFKWVLRDTTQARAVLQALSSTVTKLQTNEPEPNLPGM